MPLITVSHFFAPSAGIRPGNAVLTGFAEIPMRFAIAFAMSTSNPKIDPFDFVSSIGGDVGAGRKVRGLIGAAPGAAPPPPAVPRDSAGSASTVVSRFISPPRWEKRSLLRRLALVAVGARSAGGRRSGHPLDFGYLWIWTLPVATTPLAVCSLSPTQRRTVSTPAPGSPASV